MAWMLKIAKNSIHLSRDRKWVKLSSWQAIGLEAIPRSGNLAPSALNGTLWANWTGVSTNGLSPVRP